MLAISIAIVSGPTPPGTGVSAPAVVRDVGVHVADEHGAAALEHLEAVGVRAKIRRASSGVRHGVDADVDHDRAGFDVTRA